MRLMIARLVGSAIAWYTSLLILLYVYCASNRLQIYMQTITCANFFEKNLKKKVKIPGCPITPGCWSHKRRNGILLLAVVIPFCYCPCQFFLYIPGPYR